MYDVTTRFLRALRVGGTVDVSCTAWASGEYLGTVPVTGGTVTVDASKVGVRRTMTLETTADQWDALSAYGIELRPFRGVRYADGTEELYDHRADPNEWTNLAGDKKYADVVGEHRRWLPKIDFPPAPDSKSRVLTYDPKTDEAVWEGTVVRRNDPIPE